MNVFVVVLSKEEMRKKKSLVHLFNNRKVACRRANPKLLENRPARLFIFTLSRIKLKALVRLHGNQKRKTTSSYDYDNVELIANPSRSNGWRSQSSAADDPPLSKQLNQVVGQDAAH